MVFSESTQGGLKRAIRPRPALGGEESEEITKRVNHRGWVAFGYYLMVKWLGSQAMKYNLLLKTLRILMYLKRFSWLVGRGLFFVLGGLSKPFLRFFALIHYKTEYSLKKHGLVRPDNWILQRGNLQIFIFLALFLVAVPQTILFKKQDSFAEQKN